MMKTLACYSLNFMGVLSVQMCGNNVELSIFAALLNSVKLVCLVTFKKTFHSWMGSAVSLDFNDMILSPFSMLFLTLHDKLFSSFPYVLLLIQLMKANQNISLINEMVEFHKECLKAFPMTRIFFHEFERNCLMRTLLCVIIGLIAILADFAFSLQHTFRALLVYVIYTIPQFVILTIILYISLIMQFVIVSQKALKLTVKQLENEHEYPEVIESLVVLEARLYAIKDHFISLISTSLLLTLIFYVMGIVTQVSCSDALN